jgi:hypothetical protein
LDKTRVVRLKTGKLREEAHNAETMIIDLDPALSAGSFRRMFVQNYERIRELCQGYQREGLAMVAVDHHGVGGTACLAAKQDRINVAFIGRHGMADLYLDGDPSLSLRHLLVILHPLRPGDDGRFRLVDLRTAGAFMDENGRRLEALEAEGPLFIACGRYAIFFLPTGDELPWPDDPDEGWDCIPERVYLDDTIAEPDRWHRRKRKARAGKGKPQKGRTLVQTFRGPLRARRKLLEQGEAPLGELAITSEHGANTIVIGATAADEGILLGRYERCDTEGLPVLSHASISRVHFLMIRIAGQIYAIDAASTNGVYVDGEEVRLKALPFGQRLMLGTDLAHLLWRKPELPDKD